MDSRSWGQPWSLASPSPADLRPAVAGGARWGQIWIWGLVPQTALSSGPSLLSRPISSPDEPLKWQYVDQFVSESEVRARTTVMRSGGNGLQGGAAGPEGKTCSRDVPSGASQAPRCIQKASVGGGPSARSNWYRHPAPPRDRMGAAVFMSSRGHLLTYDT